MRRWIIPFIGLIVALLMLLSVALFSRDRQVTSTSLQSDSPSSGKSNAITSNAANDNRHRRETLKDLQRKGRYLHSGSNTTESEPVPIWEIDRHHPGFGKHIRLP